MLGGSSGPLLPLGVPDEALDNLFRQTPESLEINERQVGSAVGAQGSTSGLLRVRGQVLIGHQEAILFTLFFFFF